MKLSNLSRSLTICDFCGVTAQHPHSAASVCSEYTWMDRVNKLEAIFFISANELETSVVTRNLGIRVSISYY